MKNLLDIESSGGTNMRCKHCNGEVLFIDSTHTTTRCMDCSIENSQKNHKVSMTTTRYFEVKVTGCNSCPSYEHATYNDVICGEWCNEAGNDSSQLIRENKDQLTPSCPMAAQHKTESEMKCLD